MAEIDQGVAAQQVYISYMQLSDLLAELNRRLNQGGFYWSASATWARSFNAILRSAKEAFQIAPTFQASIEDLTEVEEGLSKTVMEQVLSQGSKLRGTFQAFVAMYMAPGEKTRIGFHPNPE